MKGNKIQKTYGILGWFLFFIGWSGFIVNLLLYTPIIKHLQMWGINSMICISLVWLGWGFSHHNIRFIWKDYISRTLKLLLSITGVVGILFASCLLFSRSITLEIGLIISVASLGILMILGWIARHKVMTGFLFIFLIIGIIPTLFPTQIDIFLRGLAIYSSIGAIITAITFLSPLNIVFFLCGIVFIIWAIVSMVRR